jgi:3-hydroxyisobutyrate dehydrogenase
VEEQVKQSVAILGLGIMGSGMAANLLNAGFRVTVYNRTASKAQPLVEKGASLALTPADASRGADVVLSMLADDAASREVWVGEDGALAAANPAAVLIDSSTVSPAWIRELAAAAKAHGNSFLDAPVTGSRRQAEAAQLTFLVGGDAETLEAVRPVLQPMCKGIVHVGPTGSGAKLKLVNNFLCGVQVASFAEGLAWLERSGLDMEKSVEFLKAGAPGSPVIHGVAPRMIARNYDVNFYLRLMAKDLMYALDEAAREHLSLNTAAVARALFEEAIEGGYGDVDMSAVIEPLRQNK